MAGNIVQSFLGNILGGNTAAPSPLPSAEDADFAEFAAAPSAAPSFASISGAAAASLPTSTSLATQPVPYTKWYRVWERTSLRDFYTELFIMPFILVILGIHVWGTRRNKRKVRSWAAAYVPILESEYAVVGYSSTPRSEDASAALVKSLVSDSSIKVPSELFKERAANEFATYATGRQNVALLDIKLQFKKRYNPVGMLGEYALSFFFESQPAPTESMEASALVFDGHEADFVKGLTAEKKASSGLDGFVWAVVNKDLMKTLRDERYDLSLTITKEHPRLPIWATVMSEGAEITDALLTPELIAAVESAGEDVFEALIVTDQGVDAPKTIADTAPKKRVFLSLRLPSGTSVESHASSLPIFSHFLRLPDQLVATRFRPEALRKVKATREEEIKKLMKTSKDEAEEDRRIRLEKEKKAQRDEKLKGMSATEQRKFLEKERLTEQRRSQKKIKG